MKTKKYVLIITIIIAIATILTIYFINKNKKYEFYAKVKESYAYSSIIEPLSNEKIAKKYPVIEVNVGNLKEGDIIKISSKNEFIETYPPILEVEKYEYVLNKSTKAKPAETPTTTVNIPKENPTTTKVITTTRNNTTTIKASLSKDNIVINDIETKLLNVENNKNKTSFKETAKSYFIKLVDFIFYDKDIKGVYFKDLTNKAKLTVIKLALKLDNLIEQHYPGYKEGLSSSYQNTKTKLIELYLDKTSDYCANHDDVCNQAKSDFQELKTSYGITWDFIKSLANKGIAKLKEWYEIYSGK